MHHGFMQDKEVNFAWVTWPERPKASKDGVKSRDGQGGTKVKICRAGRKRA